MSPDQPTSSTNNPWFAATMGLLGIIVGYGLHATMGAPSLPAQAGDTVAQAPAAPTPPSDPPTVDDDPMIGEEDAPITVIEFTDYQCPFCGRHYSETLSQIKKDYVDTGKVKYVVRDYPLSFHQFAETAAIASECADDQGKFWEMHDELFGKAGDWSSMTDASTVFKKYAADLGLDTGDFDNCLDNKTHADEVQKDLADGSASGVDGTPGFWIIGPDDQAQFISGAMPYATFKQAFDAML